MQKPNTATISPVNSPVNSTVSSNKSAGPPSCPYCLTARPAQKHIREQTCRPANKRTYCRACELTFDTRNELMAHMTTREHMSRIMSADEPAVVVNILQKPQRQQEERQKVLAADPYLTPTEAQTVAATPINMKPGQLASTTNPQGKLTIKFGDGQVYRSANGLNSTVEIAPAKPGLSAEETRVIGAQEKANQPIVKSGFSYADLIKHDEAYPEPTERQQKIIMWLGQWQSSGPEIMREKLKLILEKIPIADADFLLSHIRASRILTLPSKQVYGAYIDSLVRVLTTERNRGVLEFAGKDIFEFVVKLTK
jgi:hypothetical protein